MSPEECVDALIDEGVLAVVDEQTGELEVTEAYDSTRRVYYDTYMEISEEEFHESVAAVFELSTEDAADRIEELGVSREMFVDFLALRSFLDVSPSNVEVARMAELVGEVGVDVVPSMAETVTDATYESFITEHDDVVLTVWAYPCEPCIDMKTTFDEYVAAAPEGVAFAGADGAEVTELRRAFDVEAAPTSLIFRDGEHVETLRGYHTPDKLATVLGQVQA